MFCFGGESNNNSPKTPDKILGPTTVMNEVEYTYTTSTFDPDGDQLYYKWYWSEGGSGWIGPYNSNETVNVNITFYHISSKYLIQVMARDSNYASSDWAELWIRALRDKSIENSLFMRFLERYPILINLTRLIFN
jgi:hypothetical protein